MIKSYKKNCKKEEINCPTDPKILKLNITLSDKNYRAPYNLIVGGLLYSSWLSLAEDRSEREYKGIIQNPSEMTIEFAL